MFKLIMLVKKRDGLSDAEFRARWQAHSEKVLGFQAALVALRADEATFVDLAQSVLWFGEEERLL